MITIFKDLLLVTAMTLASVAAPVQSTDDPYVYAKSLPAGGQVTYAVKDTDTFGTIAENYQGSSAYWTTLWQDNVTITDPNNDALNRFNTLALETVVEQPEIADKVITSAALVTPTPEPTAVPTATTTPEPTQAPVNTANAPQPISEEALTYLGNCEAGMDPTKNTGNGYYGAFQFSYGTWQSMGTGYERADLAPLEVQKDAVKQLLQRSSIYTQFPGCARKMQIAGLI